MPFTDYEPPPKKRVCRNPEHNPPRMLVLQEGTHTYKCPSCGETQTFTVTKPNL